MLISKEKFSKRLAFRRTMFEAPRRSIVIKWSKRSICKVKNATASTWAMARRSDKIKNKRCELKSAEYLYIYICAKVWRSNQYISGNHYQVFVRRLPSLVHTNLYHRVSCGSCSSRPMRFCLLRWWFLVTFQRAKHLSICNQNSACDCTCTQIPNNHDCFEHTRMITGESCKSCLGFKSGSGSKY